MFLVKRKFLIFADHLSRGNPRNWTVISVKFDEIILVVFDEMISLKSKHPWHPAEPLRFPRNRLDFFEKFETFWSNTNTVLRIHQLVNAIAIALWPKSIVLGKVEWLSQTCSKQLSPNESAQIPEPAATLSIIILYQFEMQIPTEAALLFN